MNIAIDCYGNMIIKDQQKTVHIFTPQERQAISTACYKYAQKRHALLGIVHHA